ncbi:MAG: phage major capsid protein, partial [Clostridiales bacterium]|nr:phage major capsid protein [Clostridiales bacterium]
MSTLQTTANALATIKQAYLDAWKNQFIMSVSPFYSAIRKEITPSISFKTVAKVGQVGGFGAASEGGAMPAAGPQRYMNFSGSVKNLFVPIRITDKAIEASKKSSGSYFANLLGAEIEGAFETAKINFSRMVVAGNGTGRLATTNDNDDSTTIEVDKHRFLDAGMTIDVLNASGVLIGTRRIVGISRNDDGTGTIVVDSKIDTGADTSFITIQGSLNNEITGLEAIFDDNVTSYMGNVKASTPAIVPTVVDAEKNVTNSLIREMIAQSDDYHNGRTNMILCGSKAFRAYTDFLDDMKLTVQTDTLQGGFAAVKFLYEDRIVKIVREKFVTPDEMIGVNTEDFVELYLSDWDYMNQEDSTKLSHVAGTDYYETVIRKYTEIVCKRPGACWKLTNC